jgi:MoxR-like ATPase
MLYEPKYFDVQKAGGKPLDDDLESIAFKWKAATGRDVYVFGPRVRLAVNVARAARRPLLVSGEPGSGKTRLAVAVAEVLKWQYYEHTITSRTQASDLLWTFDALRRLNDATTPRRALQPEQLYIEPGPLWWGFDPGTAAQRGVKQLKNPADQVADPAWRKTGSGAVILIDEIDKADPDVPSDLLEPVDVRRFTVKETNDLIEATRDVLLVLTTNGDRALPPAFVRRCVVLALSEPDQAWFERIAKQHFPDGNADLHQRVAAEVQHLRGEAKPGTRKPSTAEFLDALRVCDELRIDPTTPDWADIVDTVLLKSEHPPRARSSLGTGAKTVASLQRV